jgi:hypothetical protein
MKDNEIADAIDQLTTAVNSLMKLPGDRPGVLEDGTSFIASRLQDINSSLSDVAEAIRELSQKIGSEK